MKNTKIGHFLGKISGKIGIFAVIFGVFAVFFGLSRLILDTSAKTAGSTVTVHEDYNGNGWFKVEMPDGTTYNALCASPDYLPPAEGYSSTAIKVKNDLLKKILLVSSFSPVESIHTAYRNDNTQIGAISDSRYTELLTPAVVSSYDNYASGRWKGWQRADILADYPDEFMISHMAVGLIRDEGFEPNDNIKEYLLAEIAHIESFFEKNAASYANALSQYDVFATVRVGTKEAGVQDVMWLGPAEEDVEIKATVKISVCDNDTRRKEPQGEGKLSDAVLGVYDATSGELVKTMTTSSDLTAVATEIPVGSYKIKMVTPGTGYLPSNMIKEFTVTEDEIISYDFSEYGICSDIEKGRVRVQKVDSETGRKDNRGEASIVGTKFEIVNKSSKKVKIGDIEFAPDEVLTNVELIVGENGYATLGSNILPYGNYELREKEAGTGYVISDSKVQFTIRGDTETSIVGANAVMNKVIRGDVKLKKVDQDGLPMGGVEFLIKSEDGEEVVIKTNGEGVASTKGDCGAWTGGGTCNIGRGMLIYGDYTVTELRNEANEGYILTTPRTISIATDGVEVNLGTLINSKVEPEPTPEPTPESTPEPTPEPGPEPIEPGGEGGIDVPETGKMSKTMDMAKKEYDFLILGGIMIFTGVGMIKIGRKLRALLR